MYNMCKKMIVLFFALMMIFIISGCQPSQVVPAGQIAVKMNPQYLPGGDAERYSSVLTAGEAMLQPEGYRMEAILTIPEGKLGWDGSKWLKPGPYSSIAASDVTLFSDMTIVQTGWVAIHSVDDGVYETLQPGRHFVPVEEVVFVPSGTLRYRTLPWELLSDQAACASFVCEASITNASMGDSNESFTIDMDIIFHFDVNNPAGLWDLQDLIAAIQNYIGSPIRSSRAMGAGHENTQEGRDGLQDELHQRLVAATENTPIVIDRVLIRSIVFGDTASRLAQAELDRELAAEKNRAELIKLQSDNLDAEQELEKDRASFARTEAELDAKSAAAVAKEQLSAYSGVDWRVLWVLMNGGQIPPFLREGELTQEPPAATYNFGQ